MITLDAPRLGSWHRNGRTHPQSPTSLPCPPPVSIQKIYRASRVFFRHPESRDGRLDRDLPVKKQKTRDSPTPHSSPSGLHPSQQTHRESRVVPRVWSFQHTPAATVAAEICPPPGAAGLVAQYVFDSDPSTNSEGGLGIATQVEERPFHCLSLRYHLPFHCLPLLYHLPFHCLPLRYHLPFHCLSLRYHLPCHCLSLLHHLPFHCLSLRYHLPFHCLSLRYHLPFHCLSLRYHLPCHCLSLPYHFPLMIISDRRAPPLRPPLRAHTKASRSRRSTSQRPLVRSPPKTPNQHNRLSVLYELVC